MGGRDVYPAMAMPPPDCKEKYPCWHGPKSVAGVFTMDCRPARYRQELNCHWLSLFARLCGSTAADYG